MWKANVLSLFPEMFPGALSYSLIGKALKNNLWNLKTFETKESYDHVLKVEDDKTNIETIGIIVGFYYNKYNAEQDLPSILLSDSSLSDKVNAEVIKDVYMKKQGFRINIYPLSKKKRFKSMRKDKGFWRTL